MSKSIALWKSCQWWILVFVSGTYRFLISIVSGISPEFLSCIPDSKAQESWFPQQIFLGFQNPDSVTCNRSNARSIFHAECLESKNAVCPLWAGWLLRYMRTCLKTIALLPCCKRMRQFYYKLRRLRQIQNKIKTKTTTTKAELLGLIVELSRG